MTELDKVILKVINFSKYEFRAINKITIDIGLKIEDKETVRERLTELVKLNYLTAILSIRKEDAKGTLKYKITKKGRQYLLYLYKFL